MARVNANKKTAGTAKTAASKKEGRNEKVAEGAENEQLDQVSYLCFNRFLS